MLFPLVVPEHPGNPTAVGRPGVEVAVAVWTQQVVPRMTRVALGTAAHHEIRSRVCAGLSGEVVEVGFGSGLNARHYPRAVTSVTAIEPSEVAWRLSAAERERSRAPVVRAGLDGQRLPFGDGVFDSALSTWTLCTIPDPVAALREIARVLRPGGRLFFVEHGAAPDLEVLRWQRRWDPVQRRVCAGCHVSRPIPALLEQAGLPAEHLDSYYAAGEPRLFGSLYEGRTAPAPASG